MNVIKILHLEDNEIDAEYVQSLLESQEIPVSIVVVDNKQDFLRQIQSQSYDMILADFKLPSFDGISALLLASKYAPGIPFIFVSGSMGEDLAVDALKHGATDYVLKHHISRLAPAVERALREKEERLRRKQAEEMQQRLVAILESTSDLIIITDRDLNTYFMNTAARRMLGLPMEADLSKTPVTSFHPDYVHDTIFEEGFVAAEESGTWRGESAIIDIAGRIIPVSQVIIAHKDDSGEVQYYSTTLRDISAQKEVEKNLRTAKERAEESERLKDNFIATMSHEIRTPLNVIMGYSSYFRALLEHQNNKDLQECLWSIDRAGKRLMRTVDNILNVSMLRLGGLRMTKELLDLNEEVRYLYKDFYAFAEEKGLEFVTSFEEKAAIISADKFSLRGAMLNIIDNALKFTKTGEVKLRVYIENGFAYMECSDTGIGISEEYQKRLFKLFSQEEEGDTRSFDGLGLGLALSNQYTELNGGKLEVSSEKGQGPTVRMKFPVAGIFF